MSELGYSREDIADKVNKLLALANSSNEHEAKLAATRAMEMLAKYNLSGDDLKQRKFVREFIPKAEPKQAKWKTVHQAGAITKDIQLIQQLLTNTFHRHFQVAQTTTVPGTATQMGKEMAVVFMDMSPPCPLGIVAV